MSDCKGEKYILDKRPLPTAGFDDTIFSHGRSVYEIIRVIDRAPLFLGDHLERLYGSLEGLGLETSLSPREIERRVRLLISLNPQKEGNIRVVLHFPGDCARPLFLAYYTGHKYPGTVHYEKGVEVALFATERPNPHTKLIDVELRSRMDSFIKKNNVYEILLVDRNGFVTEGSKSNFFFVKNDRLLTAPEEDVLQGITRKYIFSICQNRSIDIIQRKISRDELPEMESCFITGTSPKVLPVKRIGDFTYNAHHPLVRKLMEEYDRLIEDYISRSHNTTFST